MPKVSRFPQDRHHIMIYNEDWNYLQYKFGPDGLRPIGLTTVLRELIHQWVVSQREEDNQDNHRRSYHATPNI